MNTQRWIIDPNSKYVTAQTSTYLGNDGNEYVAYTGEQRTEVSTDEQGVETHTIVFDNPETIEQYLEKHPNFKAMDHEEFEKWMEERHDALISAPEEITQERWYEMLEILPPCRWGDIGSWNLFHVSERLSGNLVNWFAKHHSTGRYFEFTHYADAGKNTLLSHLKEVAL